MDRSDAATRLLEWQFEGQGDLVRAAGRDGDQTLLAIVESVAAGRPPRPVPERPSRPPTDFVKLDEERDVVVLRARLAALMPVLSPEERQTLEAHLRPDLMPTARLARIRAEMERLGSRVTRRTLQEDFEARIVRTKVSPAAVPPRTVLLFSRDGRLLASEGSPSSLDVTALSQLVSRGESGSTWSLAHPAGIVLGHVGQRAALVAVFPGRPQANAGGALRVSLQSLEERERLVSALRQPASHKALTAFVRAVQALLQKTV